MKDEVYTKMPAICVIDEINSIKEKKFSFYEAGADEYEFVGVFDEKAVATDWDTKIYLLNVPNNWLYNKHARYEPIINLEISRIGKRGRKFEVDFMYINHDYRGKNLAPRFYHFMITKLGIQLVSGNEQSLGGRSIWTRLAEYEDLDIRLGSSKTYRRSKNKIKTKLSNETAKPVIDDSGIRNINSINSVFIAKGVNR